MLWCWFIIKWNAAIIIKKVSGSLWQYYRDKPSTVITNSKSFIFKIKITKNTPPDGNTKDIKIALSLKYFSNFWKPLEMLLTNCEINVIITWYENCVISSAIKKTKFTIKDTKIYVPIVTLSTQVNAKLLELLNSCFKRTISWNKQQAKVPTDRKN